jgi:hypothetical protein
MLKEQHIPLSVGNMVKMLEQFREMPFQEQDLSIPEMKSWLRNLWNFGNREVLTKFILFGAGDAHDIVAGHLWVPE